MTTDIVLQACFVTIFGAAMGFFVFVGCSSDVEDRSHFGVAALDGGQEAKPEATPGDAPVPEAASDVAEEAADAADATGEPEAAPEAAADSPPADGPEEAPDAPPPDAAQDAAGDEPGEEADAPAPEAAPDGCSLSNCDCEKQTEWPLTTWCMSYYPHLYICDGDEHGLSSPITEAPNPTCVWTHLASYTNPGYWWCCAW